MDIVVCYFIYIYIIIYNLSLLIIRSRGNGNNTFMLVFFSSIADNTNPGGNNEPPEWAILLMGVFVTICVGYCMQRVLVNISDYFYPKDENNGSKLDSDKSAQNSHLDQNEQFEVKEKTDEEKILEQIELVEKKRRDEIAAEELARQIRRFLNGGKRPFDELLTVYRFF